MTELKRKERIKRRVKIKKWQKMMMLLPRSMKIRFLTIHKKQKTHKIKFQMKNSPHALIIKKLRKMFQKDKPLRKCNKVKQLMPECVSIFILPPSMKVLEKRLRGRGTEDEETIQKRLAKAREEIPHAKDYDYIVYNDALEDAVSDLRAIIKAEKLKFSRNTNSIERVLEDAETVR